MCCKNDFWAVIPKSEQGFISTSKSEKTCEYLHDESFSLSPKEEKYHFIYDEQCSLGVIFCLSFTEYRYICEILSEAVHRTFFMKSYDHKVYTSLILVLRK